MVRCVCGGRCVTTRMMLSCDWLTLVRVKGAISVVSNEGVRRCYSEMASGKFNQTPSRTRRNARSWINDIELQGKILKNTWIKWPRIHSLGWAWSTHEALRFVGKSWNAKCVRRGNDAATWSPPHKCLHWNFFFVLRWTRGSKDVVIEQPQLVLLQHSFPVNISQHSDKNVHCFSFSSDWFCISKQLYARKCIWMLNSNNDVWTWRFLTSTRETR